MRYLSLIFCLAAVWPQGASASASSKSNLGSPEALWETIPIVAWHGIPAQFATVERYKEMADAGFTMSVIPDGRPTSGVQLDCAAEAGIKIILQDQKMLTDPELVVSEFKDHPALGMYYLRDEPNTEYFSKLDEVRKYLLEADPSHVAWINLYPNYATEEQMGVSDYATYVKRFLEEVRPAFLSFDHYGIVRDSGLQKLRPAYYSNLELIARSAREHKIPFWAFALTTPHGPHEIPTEAELKFQVFSCLAYGARGIQYFTYWTPLNPDGSFIFHDGPILEDGTRTPLLDVIKKVNGEIRALTPELVKLEAVGVQHFKSDDPDVEKFTPGKTIRAINGEDAVLVGFFVDKAGTDWAFFVNRSFEAGGEVKVATAPDVLGVEEVSKKDGSLVRVASEALPDRRVFTVALEAGEGRLFKLKKSN